MILLRLLSASIRHRPGRVLLLTLTLLAGFSLEAALINLSFDIGGRSEEQMKAFGSNAVLVPRQSSADPQAAPTGGGQEGIPQAQLEALDGPEAGVSSYAPFAYAVATVNGSQAALLGTRFDQATQQNPWWKISGRIPGRGDPTGVILGADLARRLSVQPGDPLDLRVGGNQRQMTISGIMSTGGPEDDQALADLDAVQALSGMKGTVNAVEVALPAGEHDSSQTARLESLVPSARARTVEQVAGAEASVLDRIRFLMGLVTALIVGISAITVGAVLANSIMDRKHEIGLMKALGAGNRLVMLFIIAEAGLMAAVSVPASLLAGLAIANFVGFQVFGSAVSLHLLSVPILMASCLLLTFVSSIGPIRRVASIRPAVMLRGD